MEEGKKQADELNLAQEQGLQKHAELEEKVRMLRKRERKTEEERMKKQEDVAVGGGEGQAREQVGFREALEDVRHKNVHSEEVTIWIDEAVSKVYAESTTNGLASEASSRLRDDAFFFFFKKKKTETSQAHLQERANT